MKKRSIIKNKIEGSFYLRNSYHGQGLFTSKAIPKGKILFTIKGKVLDADLVTKLGGKLADNCLRFGPNTYLSPENEIARFINHSCSPNAGIRKVKNHLELIAITSIKTGEEITFDYSTTLAWDDIWRINKCYCGQKSCRKKITNFPTLPIELQKHYLNLGVVPKYILG